MKKNLILSGIVLGALLICLQAYANPTVKQGYQTATVVSVEKHETPSNYVGDNPMDAPMQVESYSYDIGIRLDCNVFFGRYESATDYLPSAFAPNHQVDVRLQKHIMYVSLPSGDREVKMGIVGHQRVKNEGCPAKG
jgi:hypothetical protein